VESRTFFEQAQQWNHSDAPLIHLMELLALERKYEAYDSLMQRIVPESHFWLTGTVIHALQRGGPEEWARAEAALRRASDRDLRTVASHTLYLLEDAAAVERALRLTLEPLRPPQVRVHGHLLLAHLYLSGGRWRAAMEALDSAHALDPASTAAHAGVLLLGTPLVQIPVDHLGRLRSTVGDLGGRGAGPASPSDSLDAVTREYTLALMDLRLGQTDKALRRASALERDHPTEPQGLAGALAAGLRAQVALLDGDPARADAELRAIRWKPRPRDVLGFSPVSDLRRERFVRAEALDRLGRHEEALGWLSGFDEHSPAGRMYLAPAHFRRGEILERLQRPAEAAASYRRFIGLWADADPELQGLVAEARRRVAQLSSRH
jgi:tetratricopeptide (TPR) repeat protein